MFGFSKKTTLHLASPVPGQVIDITAVKDEVFSKKMMGDGFAVIPETGLVTAPCDGSILLLADTLHALAMECGKVQFLIHIGLETVDLQGRGFKAFVKNGDVVKKGDPLIAFDVDFIQTQGKDPTVIVVLTNLDELPAVTIKKLAGPTVAMDIEYSR